jgi:hypothetical protein
MGLTLCWPPACRHEGLGIVFSGPLCYNYEVPNRHRNDGYCNHRPDATRRPGNNLPPVGSRQA